MQPPEERSWSRGGIGQLTWFSPRRLRVRTPSRSRGTSSPDGNGNVEVLNLAPPSRCQLDGDQDGPDAVPPGSSPGGPTRFPAPRAGNHLASWSSLECSPSCQGGGRGFESRRCRVKLIHLIPDDPEYPGIMDLLRAEPLRTQWWNDAKSEVEPGVSYLMVLAEDDRGDMVPAAWAGYRVDQADDGPVLWCCNNYVRHGFRDRAPELYAQAYTARHREVVTRLGIPAYTYLYAQPIALHLVDGWVYDRSPHGRGMSRPPAPGVLSQPWWRLLWQPE
jgi:hypothetical protein